MTVLHPTAAAALADRVRAMRAHEHVGTHGLGMRLAIKDHRGTVYGSVMVDTSGRAFVVGIAPGQSWAAALSEIGAIFDRECAAVIDGTATAENAKALVAGLRAPPDVAPGLPRLYDSGVRYAPDPDVEPPRDRNAGDCVDDAGPCPICGRLVLDLAEHAPGCAVGIVGRGRR